MSSDRLDSAVDGSLAAAVDEMVSALPIGPQDAALVALARILAETVDEMSPETRQKMLGQTTGALLSTLKALRERAPARPVSVPSAAVSKLAELQARRAARVMPLDDSGS